MFVLFSKMLKKISIKSRRTVATSSVPLIKAVFGLATRNSWPFSIYSLSSYFVIRKSFVNHEQILPNANNVQQIIVEIAIMDLQKAANLLCGLIQSVYQFLFAK